MHRHGGNCICYESISSDSPELLGLSGDLRCFKVMETPIQEFCTSALLKNAYDRDERGDVVNSRVTQKREYFSLFPLRRSVPIASNDGHGSESVLRMLFQVCMREGLLCMLVFLVLHTLAAGMRLYWSQQARAHFSEILLIPMAVILLVFVPLSLPGGMFLAEIITTADLLVTWEALHHVHMRETEEGPEAQPPHHHISPVSGLPPAPPPPAPVPDSSSKDTFSDDEFNDADIDDRMAGKDMSSGPVGTEVVAAESIRSIETIRRVQYALHVAKARLGLTDDMLEPYLPKFMSSTSREDEGGVRRAAGSGDTRGYGVKDTWMRRLYRLLVSKASAPLLPVPFASSRVVEAVGAVTMMCFVDDDIICEGYSVSEEIFLLNSQDVETSTENGRGTVMDLHANPQATGTRFEDPNWHMRLPSLKPIGNSHPSYGDHVSSQD
eukprot:gene330-341_t